MVSLEKKSPLLVLAVLLALAVTIFLVISSKSKNETPFWKEYSVAKSGYSFKAPPEWNVDLTGAALVVVRSYKLPPASVKEVGIYKQGEVKIQMGINYLGEPIKDLNNLVEKYKKDNPEGAKEVKRTNLDEENGHWLKVVWLATADNHTSEIYYHLLPKQDQVFVYAVYGNLNSENRKKMEKILKTIRFR